MKLFLILSSLTFLLIGFSTAGLIPQKICKIYNNIGFFSNPLGYAVNLLEINYKEFLHNEDDNFNEIILNSQSFLLEKAMITRKDEKSISSIFVFYCNFFRQTRNDDYKIYALLQYTKQCNEYLKGRIDVRVMIDSVRRRLGDGEDIVKEFIKNSKEQLEEISFIVFYAYFIEESSSFKTFLRENFAKNKNNKFEEKFTKLFGFTRFLFLRKVYPELFGVIEDENKIIGELFKNSLDKDFSFKWRSRMVLDFFLYKQWYKENFDKNENEGNEEKEEEEKDPTKTFWNKIFKNYWYGVDLLIEHVTMLKDPPNEEIDAEIVQNLLLEPKNYFQENINSYSNFLHAAKICTNQFLKKMKNVKKGKKNLKNKNEFFKSCVGKNFSKGFNQNSNDIRKDKLKEIFSKDFVDKEIFKREDDDTIFKLIGVGKNNSLQLLASKEEVN
ncbi:hypothetical protein ACQ4LE_000033, partial [Meloidogyne hapla]